MGVDLYWRPKKNKIVFQECTGSSQAIRVRDQFGPTVNENDIAKLRHFYEATGEKIYLEMAEAVEKNREITIEVS